MRIAYQGEPGAFSHEACLRFAPDAEPTPCPGFEDAVAFVREGAGQAAMLPVENSLAGPVEPVLALLARAGLTEVGRFVLPIRMMLAGLPGAELAGVRWVASHPVALAQCRRVIAELRLEETPVFDTAGAARLVAQGADPAGAALASRAAAERWGLRVLRADVQDEMHNRTTFVRVEA